MKRKVALLLAIIMLICSFAACGETEEPEKPQIADGGRFRTYFSVSPPTLNPFKNSDTAASDFFSYTIAHVYNDRATADGNGWEWVNELAETEPQKMDEEGKVWRIKMREGLKWQNGDKLDANDIVYSYKMFCDPLQLNICGSTTSSPLVSVTNLYAYANQGDADTVKWEDVGIKLVDDLNYELYLDKPVPMMNVMRWSSSIYPVYQPLYDAGLSEDKSFTDYGTSIDKFMASGAFYLTDWQTDAKFVLDRNPNFVRADEIHLDGMDISIVKETQTAVELFLQGKLDYCAIAYTDWEQFEDDPRVHEYFADSLMYMMINIGNPDQNNLLGSKNFRKALFYGIDRQGIANTLGVYPATRLVRRAVVGNSNTLIPFIDIPQDYVLSAEEAYNPELANEYLTKAYEEKGLDHATEQILLSETATHIKAATEILQKQYPTVFNNKLDVTIRQLPATQAQSARRWHDDDPRSFEIALGSLLPSSQDCRYTFNYYKSTYNPPRTKWSDPEYDRIYAEAETFDLYTQAEEIVSRCQQLEKILLEEVVVNPVYERPEKALFSERVHLPVNTYVIGFGFGTKYMSMDQTEAQ